MSSRVRVYVYAADPVSSAGVASVLRFHPDLSVVGDGELDQARVAVVVADEIDAAIIGTVRAIQRNGCPRVVMVVTHVDDAGLLAAVEAGACGILRRSEVVADRLAEGWDTGAIAVKLSYSERTVKQVIHDVTNRLQLRNRSHAVAYAVRQGVI